MDNSANLIQLAQVIGETSRIKILSLLMEGRALTAKELAYDCEIEPATASNHLQRLLSNKLITETKQGRHKYFRLSSPQVAHMVESMMTVAPQEKQNLPLSPIKQARLCYDHLAGNLGVQITQAMIKQHIIELKDQQFIVTEQGYFFFATLGIDISALKKLKRKFAYPCLDWSERQDHLAGSLAVALVNKMIEQGWLLKQKASRVLNITELGRQSLQQHFNLIGF